VVSGGTKGVGRAAAEAFAINGAKVVIGGRDEESALKSIRLMKVYGSEGLFVYTDLNKVEDCKKLFDEAYAKFGKIDGFFNYAGITPVSPLDTCDLETFDAVMRINFRAAFFCCQQAVKYMRLNGGGSIVVTGSPQAWGGEKDRAAYACSKGVLLTLVNHICQNYASDHIRANYLTLGWTPTEGEVALRKTQGMSEVELRKWAGAQHPMGRMCECADYIDTLVLLMSDGASMVSGSILRATGGWRI
jgi:NAD(P)-dependent dehydrogenase (short-subunit alcohol dehydrogenase family)